MAVALIRKEIGDQTPPSVPGSFSVTAVSTSQINLSWTASTDDTGIQKYRVRRAGVVIAEPIGLSYSDTGLTASTAYSYTVSAVDTSNNESAETAPGSATTFSAGGFALKPVIPTPSLPTPLRTLFVVAGAAAGGDGSLATPFNTVQAAEAVSIAGDEIQLDGVFNVTGDVYIGMYGHGGTAAHPIVYRKKPGATIASVQFGGGINQQNTISLAAGSDYTWFVGLKILVQPNSDGRHGSKVRGANNVKFIGCEWNACGVWASGCANYEMWDCVTSGDFGTPSDSSSDIVAIRDGAVDSRIIRLVQTGNAGHASVMVYDQFAASATPKPVLRTEIFDCVIRNPWQGGLHLLGGSGFSHIHWCDIRESASNPLGTSPTSREGIECASSDNLIEHNWIHGGAGYGLALETLIVNGITETPLRNIIRHNVISDNAYVGLVFTAGTGIDVRTGIINNTVENNIIANNSRAIFPTLSADQNLNQSGGFFNGHYCPIVLFLANGTSFWPTGNFFGNIFRNNLLSVDPSVDTNVVVHMRRFPADGGSIDYTNAELVAGSAGGNNVIQQGPAFASPTNPRLLVTSPAINAGFPFVGATFLGSAPDIGAYEFGGND